MNTTTELVAWQKAMDLSVAVYEAVKAWPPDERFGLTSQIRRAVVSIPSNIAEGHGRNGKREFLHHLSIAHGSLREVETQIRLATRLAYFTSDQEILILRLCDETGRPLRGLIKYLRIATGEDKGVASE